MKIVTIYEGEDACRQCLGWKRIANSDDGESWMYWAELPAQSQMAVTMGWVKPVICPRCGGTGREPEGEDDRDHLLLDWADCPTCEGTGRELVCIDDICQGQGYCMHGADGYVTCLDCGGTGEVLLD